MSSEDRSARRSWTWLTPGSIRQRRSSTSGPDWRSPFVSYAPPRTRQPSIRDGLAPSRPTASACRRSRTCSRSGDS